MLTFATHKVSNPWGTQSVHREPFGRGKRLPMCSFLCVCVWGGGGGGDSHAWADTCAWGGGGGAAMHGRTHVHGTPMCRCPLLSKHKEQVETHAKHMVNNSRGMLCTHLHAFEMRDKLPICSFSWRTAMDEQTSIHGTHMYSCPPYWNAINRR